jgi:hypothetical protein
VGVWEKSESKNYIPFGDVVKKATIAASFVKLLTNSFAHPVKYFRALGLITMHY